MENNDHEDERKNDSDEKQTTAKETKTRATNDTQQEEAQNR